MGLIVRPVSLPNRTPSLIASLLDGRVIRGELRRRPDATIFAWPVACLYFDAFLCLCLYSVNRFGEPSRSHPVIFERAAGQLHRTSLRVVRPAGWLELSNPLGKVQSE